MRILYIANSQVWGGGEQAVLLSARLMTERGHQVDLAGDPDSPLARRFAQEAHDVSFLPLALGSKLGWRSIGEFLWRAPEYRRRLCELIAGPSTRRWDVIHLQYKKEQLLGTGAFTAGGYPVAWTEHGGLPQGIAANPVARAWYRRAARAAAGIASVSQYVARSLASAGVRHSRTRIIYNGVDERAVSLAPDLRMQCRASVLGTFGWPTTAVVVGTVCRLTRRKGLRQLVVSVLRAMQAHDTPYLLIVGDGEERKTLEAMVPPSLRARVAFPGFQRDVARYLAAIDVFVSSTVDPTEGFPIRVVEAMMAGLPVIATRVAGQPEAITNAQTGLLVAPDDPSGLFAAIERLIVHREERLDIGVHAYQEAVRRFGIQTFATAHESFLGECAGSHVA